MVDSLCVRGPASGDSFSLLCLVCKLTEHIHLTSYRPAQRVPLRIYLAEALYEYLITLHIMLHLLVALFLGKEPDTKDQFVETLPTLKDKVQKVDPNVMFSAINDLAKV